MINTVEKSSLDKEWVELIKEAKTIGLTIEEIQQFFLEVQERDLFLPKT